MFLSLDITNVKKIQDHLLGTLRFSDEKCWRVVSTNGKDQEPVFFASGWK